MLKSNSTNHLIIGLMLLLITLASTSCANRTPTPVVDPGPFPLGTFVNLDWAWELFPDGTYEYYQPEDPSNRYPGTYSLDGDRIEIQDSLCGTIKGKYIWEFNGKEIKFTSVDDSCYDRRTYMVLPWILVEEE
jgi:hypothetical protein